MSIRQQQRNWEKRDSAAATSAAAACIVRKEPKLLPSFVPAPPSQNKASSAVIRSVWLPRKLNTKHVGPTFLASSYPPHKAICEEENLRHALALQWRISKAARSSRSLIRILLSTSAILSPKSWAKEHMELFGEFLFMFIHYWFCRKFYLSAQTARCSSSIPRTHILWDLTNTIETQCRNK